MKSAQQRKNYAVERMSRAVERVVAARDPLQKQEAIRWVLAWGRAAGGKWDAEQTNPEAPRR
jgi:hypothetical protein